MKNFTLTILTILIAYHISFAQCASGVDLIDDDFESYVAGSSVPSCWSLIDNAGMITGIRNTAGNAHSGTQYILHYTLFSIGISYLVLPKINTIDGTHEADFFIRGTSPSSSFEIGTISDPTNTSTFTKIGSATALSSSYTQINSGAIPNNGDEYFALRFTNTSQHTAFYIDDFKWQESTTLGLNEPSTSSFSFFPNPAKDKIINLNFDNNGETKVIEVYNVNGQRIFSTKTVNTEEVIDLSHLYNGMYLLKVIQNNNHVTNKKLILGN
jgi:hypothetical protein